ncbi:STAS domain-containing protein [Cellulomonas sp. Y8]|uniref:STAS domain-containing protein n=1 Tax=Cellulomonas sp. Y8 TaxID=2591145 RepID=UPI003D72A521
MGRRPPPSPVLAVQPPCGAVEVRRTPQEFVLEAAGEIDASLAEPVQSAMSVIQAGGGSVEVDFSAVTFCGAEGVHMLHRLRATHRLDAGSTTLSDAAALTATICDLPPAAPRTRRSRETRA